MFNQNWTLDLFWRVLDSRLVLAGLDVHLALAKRVERLKGLPVEDPAGVMLSSGIQAPTWDEAWAAAVELATSWARDEAKGTTPDQRDQRELVMDHMQMMQSLPPPKPKKAPWRIECQ